jgi:putative tributyrin esterase
MRPYFQKTLRVLALSLVCGMMIFGQATAPKPLAPNVREHKLASKMMVRDMSYRVVLPSSYDNTNEKLSYPVIYLLHGLTGNFANWTDRTKVADYALKHNFIVVTPDGGNGWYTDSVTAATEKYESYIVKELVPEIEKKYRVKADRSNRMIAGLSMGGYGSLKFGLKYPEMFSLVGSFSGAIGAAEFTEKTAGNIGKSLDAIYGVEGSPGRAANDVFKLTRDLTPEAIKALPFIYVSCGNEDFLIANNRDYMKVLTEKKIPHEYRQHPGVHDWVFWDDQIREFLDIAARRIAKTGSGSDRAQR